MNNNSNPMKQQQRPIHHQRSRPGSRGRRNREPLPLRSRPSLIPLRISSGSKITPHKPLEHAETLRATATSTYSYLLHNDRSRGPSRIAFESDPKLNKIKTTKALLDETNKALEKSEKVLKVIFAPKKMEDDPILTRIEPGPGPDQCEHAPDQNPASQPKLRHNKLCPNWSKYISRANLLQDPNSFDFGEYFGIDENDDNFNEVDTFDEPKSLEMPIYGQKVLKVCGSISFSPSTFESEPKEGYFKATIKIQNTSKINMSYSIKCSSLKMLKIPSPIGYINPLSAKDITVTTNPRYQYEFKNLQDAFFVVFGCPVMFKSQLQPEKLDALWRAFDCSLFSWPWNNAESHYIKRIYPGCESMVNNYSIIDLISYGYVGSLCSWNVEPVIEVARQAPIELQKFHEIWNCQGRKQQAMLMKFKVYELKRWIEAGIKTENHHQLYQKIATCSVLIALCCYTLYFSYPSILKWTIGFCDSSGKLNTGFCQTPPPAPPLGPWEWIWHQISYYNPF